MSNQKHDGGTAFPMQDAQAIHAYAAAKVVGITDTVQSDRIYLAARAEAIGGMTLRDYFAGQVIAGLMARAGAPDPIYESKLAYQVADAMLAARAAHQATKEPR